ncbi:macrophage mannose receptor 1 isoform X1 [Parasteatoda tepidariorum]|uniref:macrophage mannose receptor 1 isoform X1 n=1 Tax=Parasteatoda tepidariorum TaxID=114398 RepID=UPI001C7286F5|nr:macrophage mannose receptor 1 [Parasteatoda tepidariorum]
MIATCFYLLSVILTDIAALSVNSSKVISKRQAQTSCDKGWFPFEDKCYRTGGTKEMRLNWERASERCRELGGKLASIHSKEQLDFLTAFLLMNVKETLWIGLNDRDNESQYKWDDGTPYDYWNWEPDEPSGPRLEKEDCVEFIIYSGRANGKPGQWNDLECGHDREFICQKKGKKQARRYTDARFCPPRIGGWRLRTSCYHVIEKKLPWQEAEDYCIETHNGHLVTINDFSVNLFIEYILRNYTEDMWIGIKTKNKFQQQWSSGWFVAFTNWMEDPGDLLDEACAIRNLNHQWTTVSCKRPMPFICETSTVSETAPSLMPSEEFFCPEEPAGWRDFGGDFCYYVNTDHLTWFEANFRCLRRGGTLASFHSQPELDILQPFLMVHFMKARLFSWIGLHRHLRYEEEFVWVDRTPMDFTAWANNEPNFEKEQCAEVNPNSMKWNDYFCDHHRPSVCSIQKISANGTTSSEVLTPACSSGFSTEALLGVIFCILFVALLQSVVVYYFCAHDKNGKQRRSSQHPPLKVQMSRHKSDNEIVIADDYYDNYENVR